MRKKPDTGVDIEPLHVPAWEQTVGKHIFRVFSCRCEDGLVGCNTCVTLVDGSPRREAEVSLKHFLH